MKAPHLTEVPTLANPMAFHVVDDLRRELYRANGIVLELGERLHEMSQVARETTHDLALLIKVRRIFGDDGALKLLSALEESLLAPAAPAQPNSDNHS
ncbi:hypothetical protein ACOTJH_29150 [Achromobacter xylosoxidans]